MDICVDKSERTGGQHTAQRNIPGQEIRSEEDHGNGSADAPVHAEGDEPAAEDALAPPEALQRRVMEQAEWILLPRSVEQVSKEIRNRK